MKTHIPPLNIIVAVDESGGFGKNGKIPWNIKEDMQHFKEITSGNICLMGRKTYEDMFDMYIKRNKNDPEEILPNRLSFVITSNQNYKVKGAKVARNIRDAIQQLEDNDNRKIFIIGGYKMFIESMPWVSTIYLTLIKGMYDCDVFFPVDVLNKKFTLVEGEEKDKLYFLTYKRSAL